VKKFFLITTWIFYTLTLVGQDDFFTSFRNGGLLINPAETGRIEGQTRLVMATRSQWWTISKNAFLSFYTGVESQIFCLGRNYFGAGILLVNERSGASGFQRSLAMPSFSYHQQINEQIYLSAGLKIGVLQQKLGNNSLSFNAQFNGLEFDAGLDNGENFDQLNLIKADAEAGLLIYNKDGNWSFGAAFDHLLTPNMSFLEGSENELGIGLKFHGNISFSDYLGFHAMYRDYALIGNTQWHSILGIYSKIFESVRSEVSLRIGDGIATDSVIFGFIFNNGKWDIGVNYDAGISNLSRGTFGFNGVELFGSIIIGTKKPCVNCPRF
jgi:type IX secretion system PorP/SprF family membrane protein